MFYPLPEILASKISPSQNSLLYWTKSHFVYILASISHLLGRVLSPFPLCRPGLCAQGPRTPWTSSSRASTMGCSNSVITCPLGPLALSLGGQAMYRLFPWNSQHLLSAPLIQVLTDTGQVLFALKTDVPNVFLVSSKPKVDPLKMDLQHKEMSKEKRKRF